MDTRKADRQFTEEDLELFATLAAQSALAIDNVQLYEQMVEAEKKRANLGRFLSPAVVEALMEDDTPLKLGGQKRTVTTLFCDIRGFTAIAEQLAPDTLVGMLNEHFTAMTEIVFRMDGTLDKFIGDEVMAVFGSPLSRPDDANRAVYAALAMQEKNAELNQQRVARFRPTFELGIGVATGEVVAGCVGSLERMEFTVVGDRVNTARRLCSHAGAGQVVVGEATFELVKETVEARKMGTVMLKGKALPVSPYEIIRLKSS